MLTLITKTKAHLKQKNFGIRCNKLYVTDGRYEWLHVAQTYFTLSPSST